jgi:curved DNA-binding protein CbpA
MNKKLLIAVIALAAASMHNLHGAEAGKTQADVDAQLKAWEGKSALQVLGLNPGSTDAEINKAYRSLQLKWHPDKNPGLNVDPVVQHLVNAHDALIKSRPFKPLGQACAAGQQQPPQQREQKQAAEKPRASQQAAPRAPFNGLSAKVKSARNMQAFERYVKGFQEELNKLDQKQLELFATYFVYDIFDNMFKINPENIPFRGNNQSFKKKSLSDINRELYMANAKAYTALFDYRKSLGLPYNEIYGLPVEQIKRDYISVTKRRMPGTDLEIDIRQEQDMCDAWVDLYELIYKKTGSAMRMVNGPAQGMVLPPYYVLAQYPWTFGTFAIYAALIPAVDRNLLAAYLYELFKNNDDWSQLSADEYAQKVAGLQIEVLSDAQDKKKTLKALRFALEMIRKYADPLQGQKRQQQLRNVIKGLYQIVFPGDDVEIPWGASAGQKFVKI